MVLNGYSVLLFERKALFPNPIIHRFSDCYQIDVASNKTHVASNKPFMERTHKLSGGWPSGVLKTAFDQEIRTAILFEKIFCTFW